LKETLFSNKGGVIGGKVEPLKLFLIGSVQMVVRKVKMIMFSV